MALRGFPLWKLKTESRTSSCPVDAQGKLLSGLPGLEMTGKPRSLNCSPPCLCCWEKLLSHLPRGGSHTQDSLAVWAHRKCLQTELVGSLPSVVRARSYLHELSSSETQLHVGKGAGCGSQKTGFKFKPYDLLA